MGNVKPGKAPWLAMAPQEQMAPSGSTTVQSVDRAMLLLELIGRDGTAGVTELADELGVHKSTVSRLVAALETRGFVEQLAERGKYRLGFTIVGLAGAAMASRDLSRESREVTEKLALAVGETVNLAILQGGRIVNVTESAGPSGISLKTWVGQSCAAHATSSGKVLLAALDPAAALTAVGPRPERFTPATITDSRTLTADLAAIGSQGYGWSHSELEEGLNACSAPVRDAGAAVVAALSVSGPGFRLTPDREPEVVDHVVAAALEVSRRLGFPG